jgi:hypothetical protein
MIIYNFFSIFGIKNVDFWNKYVYIDSYI